MAGLEMDRSANVNKLHDKMSFLRQYKKTAACRCGCGEEQIWVEHLDNWDVKALPENWIPNTASSKIVSAFRQKRERDHSSTLERMSREMRVCSDAISDQIRRAADEFRLQLTACDQSLKGEAERLRQLPSWFEFSAQGYHSWECVVDVLVRTNQSLNEFYIRLDELEQERSDCYKRILHEYKTTVCRIAHLTPFKAQEYFEMMILKVNQSLLCNASSRNDLYNKLHYLVYRMGCGYQKKTHRIKRDWRRATELQWIRMEEERLMGLYGEAGETDESQDWDTAVQQLEGYVADMAEVLKDSITQVFRTHQIGKMPILTTLNFRQNYMRGSLSEVSFIGSFLDVNLDNVSCFLNEVRSFLNETYQMWSLHQGRSSHKRDEISKELDKRTATFEKAYNQKLQKSLPLLSQLRKEGAPKKLNKSYKKARKALATLQKTCETELDKQIALIQTYDEFMDEQIDKILEESEAILERCDNKAPKFSEDFPEELQVFKFKLISLVNWKLGLFSAIKKFTNIDKATLKQWTLEFSLNFIENVRFHFDTYESYLRVLSLDLEADVEMRRFELKLHAGRLKEHNKGVKANIKLLKTNFKKTTPDDKPTYKEDCVTKVNYLQQSNQKFKEDLINFDDGGNYASAEAKKMEKALAKNDKVLVNEETTWKKPQEAPKTADKKKTKKSTKGSKF